MAAGDDGVRKTAYEAPDAHDLRQRVRRMGTAEPLSPEWMEMAEIIAAMEAKDRDELCVRFIIEEGKINLMLRSMVSFKEWHYEAQAKGRAFDDEQLQRIRMFESGLSTLLRHALCAEEARCGAGRRRGTLATTIDITLLCEHVERVLHYLHSILRQADKLADEDKVLTMLLDRNIVPLVLKHYALFRSMDRSLLVRPTQ
eukprot:gene49940-37822_t